MCGGCSYSVFLRDRFCCCCCARPSLEEADVIQNQVVAQDFIGKRGSAVNVRKGRLANTQREGVPMHGATCDWLPTFVTVFLHVYQLVLQYSGTFFCCCKDYRETYQVRQAVGSPDRSRHINFLQSCVVHRPCVSCGPREGSAGRKNGFLFFVPRA